MQKAKIKKSLFWAIVLIFPGFFSRAEAAGLPSSLPLNTEIVAKLQSEWVFSVHSSQHAPLLQRGKLPESPGLVFETQGSKIYFTLMPRGGIAAHEESPSAYGLVKISTKYFQCSPHPMRLWFDNGKFVETGETICQLQQQEGKKEEWVIGQAPFGEISHQKQLAHLLKHHHLIAVSQPKKIIMLYYRNLAPWKAFSREIL